MKVRYELSFEKDLKTLRNKKLLRRIKEIIEEIKDAAALKDTRNIKKLKGYETYYRIKIGEYRIGIELVEESVIFVRLLYRKDIYRYFP